MLIPVAIFVIGPCEELLFRGVVQRRLREVASAPVAIVAASALFAAAHVVALIGNLAAMAVTISILFFPALVFGVLYEYTKNVTVTALVHGLYDAVLFGLLYVALTFAPESAQPDGGAAAAAAVDALALLL
nr:CPBP family intramembrane glutamic endopeptidase [Halorubellus sp. JP-L1]